MFNKINLATVLVEEERNMLANALQFTNNMFSDILEQSNERLDSPEAINAFSMCDRLKNMVQKGEKITRDDLKIIIFILESTRNFIGEAEKRKLVERKIISESEGKKLAELTSIFDYLLKRLRSIFQKMGPWIFG